MRERLLLLDFIISPMILIEKQHNLHFCLIVEENIGQQSP